MVSNFFTKKYIRKERHPSYPIWIKYIDSESNFEMSLYSENKEVQEQQNSISQKMPVPLNITTKKIILKNYDCKC